MNELIRKKFKLFRESKYIYLDSAAMTPIPTPVVNAVQKALDFRGNPGRSAHPLAQRSAKLLDQARDTVAAFVGSEMEEIVFTKNTTDGINLAVDALSPIFEDGDVVVLSGMEHHSNILPYLKLRRRGVHTKFVPIEERCIRPEDVVKVLTPKTKIVAITHCSNVLGTINDVAAIGSAVKKYNKDIIYIVDGAQAVAHIPVDVKEINCDMYVFSGHKMYGPDGIGVLYIKKSIHHLLAPARPGGGTVNDVAVTSGSDYDIISPDYDSTLSVMEGGTANVSGAYGLAEAMRFLNQIGMDKVREHEIQVTEEIMSGLDNIKGLIVHGPKDAKKRVGLVSFSVEDVSPKELGLYLAGNDICVRYGSHCAFPLTNELGQETVRLSVGVYTTKEDVEVTIEEIESFVERKRGESKNKKVAILKNIIVPKHETIIRDVDSIEKNIKEFAKNEDAEIIIMGGHFLGIPDVKKNTFYPSIAPLVPEHLHSTLEEFGMTTFPLVTLDVAANMVSRLKADGIKAKLFIIANDTTGINELRLSSANIQEKTADEYRQELLSRFTDDVGVPNIYIDVLKKHGLSIEDVVKFGDNYFVRETKLRQNFKDFVSKNKKFFRGLIDYQASDESIDVDINILNDNSVKTCTFDTFHSKTGGTFCIVEVAQLLAEVLGKDTEVSYDYVHKKILSPLLVSDKKALIMLTPAMCDGAVTRAGELYSKIFKTSGSKSKFMFLNVPFGPHAERSLCEGIMMTDIRGRG